MNYKEIWEDLRCVVEINATEYSLEFNVYEVFFTNSEIMYQTKDSHSYPKPTADIANAQVFISGYIRYDGCMDIQFPEQVIHFCDKQGIKNVYDIISRVRECGKYITKWYE